VVAAEHVGHKVGGKGVPRIAAISYMGLTRLINSVIPHYQGVASIRTVDHGRYPLRDAANAHQAVESRRTTGSTILTV